MLKQHTPTIFASWFSNVLHKALSFSQLNHDWNVTIRLLYALTPLFSHLSRLFSCHDVYWMTHSTCLSFTVFNELSQIIQCSIHSIFPVLSLRFPHFFFFTIATFVCGPIYLTMLWWPVHVKAHPLVWFEHFLLHFKEYKRFRYKFKKLMWSSPLKQKSTKTYKNLQLYFEQNKCTNRITKER